MKRIILAILIMSITNCVIPQNTWSKEYDLGKGRDNFLRNMMIDHDEGKI